MLSRRLGRLGRFRKTKRRLRERLRQRIFFRDRVMPEGMEKPRVVVLTGAGISAESGIRTFRAADGLWEEHRVEDVATPEGFARNPELVQFPARSCRLSIFCVTSRKRSPSSCSSFASARCAAFGSISGDCSWRRRAL